MCISMANLNSEQRQDIIAFEKTGCRIGFVLTSIFDIRESGFIKSSLSFNTN